MEYTGLTDEEILKSLTNAEAMEDLVNSDGWQLVNEACKRITLQAQEELLKVPAGQTIRIIELQQIIKLYRNVLTSLVSSFRAEGRMAFDEAKERGIIKSVTA